MRKINTRKCNSATSAFREDGRARVSAKLHQSRLSEGLRPRGTPQARGRGVREVQGDVRTLSEKRRFVAPGRLFDGLHGREVRCGRFLLESQKPQFRETAERNGPISTGRTSPRGSRFRSASPSVSPTRRVRRAPSMRPTTRYLRGTMRRILRENTVALLKAIGGECAGAVAFLRGSLK